MKAVSLRTLVGSAFVLLACITPVWPVSPALHIADALFVGAFARAVFGPVLLAVYLCTCVLVGKWILDQRPWDLLFGQTAMRDVRAGLVLGAVSVSALWIPSLVSAPLVLPPADSIQTLLLLAASTALVTSVGEEIILRGLLQPWLARFLPIVAVVLLQGALFTLIHQGSYMSPSLAVWYFTSGCCFSLAAIAYRTLWPAITWHFLWNFSFICATGKDLGSDRVPGLLQVDTASLAATLPLLSQFACAAFLASRGRVQEAIQNSLRSQNARAE
jgi:membrane protease YdiL (CAAX protease family)